MAIELESVWGRRALGLLALGVSAWSCGGAGADDAAELEQKAELLSSSSSLGPIADASVRRTAPDTNFSSATSLDLSRTLVKFSSTGLSTALGADGYLVSATLQLQITSPLRRFTTESAYRLTQSWTEAGATWHCAMDSNRFNNRQDCSGSSEWRMDGSPPLAWQSFPTSTISIPPDQTGSASFDVTEDVRAFVSNPSANQGWMLDSSSRSEFAAFGSRESAAGPKLVLQVRRCSAAECDDGNPCTQDSCDSTAQCVHLPSNEGGVCNDGNACTQTDRCQAGVCAGSNPVACNTPDACHLAGSCNPASGQCSNPIAPNGSPCSDGSACTQLDSCQAGACVGSSPVVCASSDACHPGTCDPANGNCSSTLACPLFGVGSFPGTAIDHLLSNTLMEDGSRSDQLSAFGSAITYTGVGNLYVATPDRGPNNGLDTFIDRYYLIDLSLAGGVVTPTLRGAATLTQSAGVPFLGLSNAFDATNSPASRRFDPEGLRVDPSGNFFVSDEYGPFLYEFDATGRRVRSFALPSKFAIANPNADGNLELPPGNTSGRQSNRGMEGLAITPDGQRLYGIMQNALIQDGALNASNQRRGINNRILEVNTATGATREFLYQLDNASYGVNELVAVNDHQFLTIERDGNAGTAAAFKRLMLIDIAAASDISGVSALPQTGTPAGVTPVSKRTFLDLLSPEYALAGASFPEKIEGLAFGPDLADGSHPLVVTNDNDGITTNPNNFYVFRIQAPAVPSYQAQLATFPDLCEGVSCPAQGSCRLPGICNPGTGQCSDPAAVAGTAVGAQATGDCRRTQCDGAGNVASVIDDTDVPSDGLQCTSDVCSAGTPSNPPTPAGTACNQNGGALCNGAGACVQCLAASDCPGADTECASRTCISGSCGLLFAAAGTVTSSDQAGDCKRNQCDGSGNEIQVIDDSDLPVDGNACTSDVCTSGVPSHPATAAGSSCGNNLVCDGQGACANCNTSADCPAPPNPECAQAACVNHTCGATNSPSGTLVSGQTSADCQLRVCDGAGGITSINDPSDPIPDGNACTTDLCVAGSPSYSNAQSGTACSQNGGNLCDGSGACINRVRVLRIGDGSGALSGTAAPEFIDEYEVSGGAVISTVAFPTSASGVQQPLTNSGSATSNGALQLSADGRYLVTAGYAAVPGTASVTGTTSAAVKRVVGRLDALGNLDTSTLFDTAFSTDNVRGATSVDGSGFWVSGNGSGATTRGIWFAPFGSTVTSQQSQLFSTNSRWVAVFGGQLYGSASSGAFTNVFTVGSGLPTSGIQTVTSLPGMPTSAGSPYGFVLFDLDTGIAGVDRSYVADDRAIASGGGIQKWNKLANGTWQLVATFTLVNSAPTAVPFRGVTGYVSAGSVVLLATTGETVDTNSRLVRYLDDGSTSTPTGSVIAAAGTNKVFRGVALSPHR